MNIKELNVLFPVRVVYDGPDVNSDGSKVTKILFVDVIAQKVYSSSGLEAQAKLQSAVLKDMQEQQNLVLFVQPGSSF